MRRPRLAKGLLSLGLLSGFLVGAAGCTSEYGLFDVHTQFSSVLASDRQDVEKCTLTVKDPGGATLLRDYLIEAISDSGGNVQSGCAGGGRTPRDIGDISYSTSRTSGQLTFTVNAVDANDKILQTGSTTSSIKVFHGKGDEQRVEVTLTTP